VIDTTHLAALGPFFAVHTHHEDGPVAPWRPISELVTDPAVLHGRVRTAREYLAAGGGQSPDAVEQRVAASVTHLGLVARLVSPTLAVAAGGALLDLDPERTWWQPVQGGAFPLSVSADSVTAAAPDRLPELIADRLLAGPVRTLGVAALSMSVSEHVLWGNVASAVHGAASMIAASRPSWARRAMAIAARLLELPPLLDTGTTVDGRFRRLSCCLIYRAAPGRTGPICGDCVLASSISRSQASRT
jgi:hypothetical protein